MAQSSRQKKAPKVNKSPSKAEIIDSFNTQFKKIGEVMPQLPGADNRTPLLWDYFRHHHLCSYARATLDANKKQLVREGIIFDPEKEQRSVGEHVLHSGVLSVLLTVKKPGNRIDADKLVSFLAQKGVKQGLLTEAIEYATFQTRPAHEFKPLLMIP